MDLELITLREHSIELEDVTSVSMTADMKLLSMLNRQHVLKINLVSSKTGDGVNISNVYAYLWQEDITSDRCYRVMCIGEDCDIFCHSISVNVSTGELSIDTPVLWRIESIFENFLMSLRAVTTLEATEILKYEEKEAIISFNERFVVTFFLSSGNPQITSFVDVCEADRPARKISLIKETIFVLNYTGTTLSIFSLISNSKSFEVDFSKNKLDFMETGVVDDFAVSLEKDIVVFHTEFSQLFCLPLEDMSCSSERTDFMSSTAAVTAFTKQFPSGQRAHTSLRHPSFTVISGVLQPVMLTLDSGNLKLKHMALFNGKLCFLLSSASCTFIGIHPLSSESTAAVKRLDGHCFIVRGGSDTFPLLLIQEKKLLLILYDVEHNKLVNELMIYHCSETAESLSHLNHWQNICINVEVLKQGLRNRQLDAIRFFLQTHEERFCQLFSQRCSDNSLRAELDSWSEIMAILLATIKSVSSDYHSQQFVKELLKISVTFVIRLLHDLSNCDANDEIMEFGEVKTVASTFFSKCLRKLRDLLNGDCSNSVSDDEDSSESLQSVANYPKEVVEQWEEWDTRHGWKEIATDSFLKGNVAMAQSYFLLHRDPSMHAHGDFEEFQKLGLDLVTGYLKQRRIDDAVTILLNLGIPVNEKLISIFKSTCERDTREGLLKKLESSHLLSEEDMRLVHFASVLEKHYPCASFLQAKQLLEEKNFHLDEWHKCAFQDTRTGDLAVGDLVEPNWANCETSAYCRVVLHWLADWDDDTRQRTLLPQFLKGLCDLNLEMSPSSVWNYLLEYGDSSLVSKWISHWVGHLPTHSSDEFPYNWELTHDMINSIKDLAPLSLRESALNELARYGVFCTEEQEDMPALLSRIGSAGCDLNDSATFSTNRATLSFSDLCHRIVHYCLQHDLIPFLFRFAMKHHRSFIAWPSCNACELPLLKMAKAFSRWTQNVEDSSLAVDAMLVTAEQLYDIPQLSVKSLLTKVTTPLNVAVLLYFDEPLRDVIKSEFSSDAEIAVLEEAFRTYPLLADSLFESSSSKQLPEVTVYQLLQGNSPFDPVRLFGWQSTNTLKGDDALSELPHFSMEKLCDRYGLKVPLTHSFYLMEGRPNFAYLKFISQEVASGNRICYSRIHLCCKQVFRFALSNFRDEKLCAACVMFMEMLGQDSLPLRVSLINANALFENLCQKCASEDAPNKVFQEISSLLQNALEDKECAAKVVAILESDVIQKRNAITPKSLLEDVTLWMPVVCLANFYGVGVGESYLTECAKSDDWLNFLAFSQIFQLPKDQVQRLLKKFSNQCIGNHLAKALEKKNRMSSEVPHQVTKVKFHRKRDLRKSLYTRIGIKDVPSFQEMPTSQDLDEETNSLCSADTSMSSDPDVASVVIMKDLFLQLLQAYNTDTPWIMLLQASLITFNPVLSVLAASYSDADIPCCFTIWLLTSLPKAAAYPDLDDDDHLLQVLLEWSEADLENLVVRAIREGKILLLWQGISVFFIDSPLVYLAEYLVSFFVHKEFDQSKETLKKFQNSLSNHKDDEPHPTHHSLIWIENMTCVILRHAAVTCNTCYERQLFLSHLSSEKFLLKHVSFPDFTKLHNMVQCLPKGYDNDSIEKFMLSPIHASYRAACWQAVKLLIQLHMYSEAQYFSTISGVPSEEVLLLQINQESEEIATTDEWSCLGNRIRFWSTVAAKIKSNNLKPQCVIEFLKVKYEASDRFGEKCCITQFLMQHLKQNHVDTDAREMLQHASNMWWCLIKAVQSEQLSAEEFDALLQSENCVLDEELPCSKTLQESEETEALEKIISRLLSKKELFQAFQVAKLFDYSCHDLDVVQLCLKLARRELDPKSLRVDEVISESPISSPSRKRSIASWTSGCETDPTAVQTEIVTCIQRLQEKTEIASAICEQIVVNYLVAAVLNRSYDEISMEVDRFAILKNVLSSKYRERFSLARSLILVYELRVENVAAFLSAEIYSCIRMLTDSAVLVMLPEDALSVAEADEGLIYNPSLVSDSFQLVVKLCPDPSLLGKKLMDIVVTLLDDYALQPVPNDLPVMVELCICAHNCYTAACNVDGISQVLHKSKILVSLLAESKKFSLMVNLLIGIARYSEMKYVFETLHEHNQIENQLLKRKLCEVPNLKLALLDYLKRCPASDNYYSALVHSFNMEREIAQDREITARASLARLCKNSSDPDLKKKLTDVMKDLVAAAENYCAADCLLQAQLCAELVNLVALQVHLCDSGKWIIGLDDMTVAIYITESSQFSEALIIADAYKHHRSWNQAVFHNVILQGNKNYFRELKSHLGVSEPLIDEVAKSYNTLPNKTEAQMKNMKWLLSHCQDIELKYNLANSLGFEDIALELNMGENAAFIQDLIVTSSNMYK